MFVENNDIVYLGPNGPRQTMSHCRYLTFPVLENVAQSRKMLPNRQIFPVQHMEMLENDNDNGMSRA